jgi:hypothetical protein
MRLLLLCVYLSTWRVWACTCRGAYSPLPDICRAVARCSQSKDYALLLLCCRRPWVSVWSSNTLSQCISTCFHQVGEAVVRMECNNQWTQSPCLQHTAMSSQTPDPVRN